MLYARKPTAGFSAWLLESLPGLFLSSSWAWFCGFFTISEAWCERTKLGRHADKAYVLVLLVTNGIVWWFSEETTSGTYFDFYCATMWSCLLALVSFQACRLSNPGFSPKGDSEAPGHNHRSALPFCKDCKNEMHLRVAHDKVTNRCIYRYDQYNLWLRSPIGAANIRYYLAFLTAQLVNSYLVWDWIKAEFYYFWATEQTLLTLLCALIWFVSGFMTCSFLHILARNVYHAVSNLTHCEIAIFEIETKGYISFDPTYFNLFDVKPYDNLVQCLTGYAKEKFLWEQPYERPGSQSSQNDKFLEAFLSITPSNVPVAQPNPGGVSDADLILQWLNQPQ